MATVSLIYEGPHAEVEVPDAGADVKALRGVPVDVPEEVAKRLLKQDTWSADKPAPKQKGSESK